MWRRIEAYIYVLLNRNARRGSKYRFRPSYREKSSMFFAPGLRVASAGNRVQPSVGLLRLKLAPGGAALVSSSLVSLSLVSSLGWMPIYSIPISQFSHSPATMHGSGFSAWGTDDYHRQRVEFL